MNIGLMCTFFTSCFRVRNAGPGVFLKLGQAGDNLGPVNQARTKHWRDWMRSKCGPPDSPERSERWGHVLRGGGKAQFRKENKPPRRKNAVVVGCWTFIGRRFCRTRHSGRDGTERFPGRDRRICLGGRAGAIVNLKAFCVPFPV